MQVRIYQKVTSAMQSPAGKEQWILEFITPKNSRFKENHMGRISANDMLSELKIKFHNSAEAIKYAQSQNYPYELIIRKKTKLKKKNYASNFA